MSINFIPNDPRAGATAPQIRTQAPRPNRPTTRSGFIFSGSAPEGTASPGTPQFLFWQCREAALAALDAWEASAGPHKKWQGNRSRLPLLQNVAEDLNAFYDRASFSFFHQTVGSTTFFSGASTDVVSHEVGHGLLDSVRPDFFSVNFLEVGAFHEAFGDCMAMLTALNDLDTRQKLLVAAANLRKKNFVEGTAEDLSEGIRRLQPNHNAATPRRAFNTFQFQLPQTLPSNGGPGALINEVHSFGMIMTGCFWDLLANIFATAPQTQAGLLSAAKTTGQILIAGAKGAVIAARFMQSVGRAMVLADQTLNAAANRDHIRNAFQAHNILLGTNTMVAPSMGLAGPAPKKATLAPATRKDLAARFAAPKGAKMKVAPVNVFGTPMVEVTHEREVALGSVDKRLKGVVGLAQEPVMVGQSGGRAAVMGIMPHGPDTDSEVQEFVKTLLAHDRIDFGGRKRAPVKRGFLATPSGENTHTTHAIESDGGKKVLVRVRFLCRNGCRCAPHSNC
jgi:hypothetical protein